MSLVVVLCLFCISQGAQAVTTGNAIIFVKGVHPGGNESGRSVTASGAALWPFAEAVPSVALDQRTLVLRSGAWDFYIWCETDEWVNGQVVRLDEPTCHFGLWTNELGARRFDLELPNRVYIGSPDKSPQMNSVVEARELKARESNPLKGKVTVYGGDTRDLFFLLPEADATYEELDMYNHRRLMIVDSRRTIDIQCTYLKRVETVDFYNMEYDIDINWPRCTFEFSGF